MPKIARAKRKEAPESRKLALVAAAYQELAERGFEGLRTREVAAAVGVNIATLHYHFPSKEALIRGVVGHALERFRSTLGSGGSSASLLRAHFDGIRRLSREEPELFAVMGELALRARRDPAIAAIIQEMDEVWHATLRGLLRRAKADGAVDAGLDPTDAAAAIVATLKGVYMLPGAAAGTKQEHVNRALRQLEHWLALSPKRRS